MKRIITRLIPIGGSPFALELNGDVVHAIREGNDVVLFVEEDDDTEGRPVELVVVNVDQDVPEHAEHVITSCGGEGFIWHVYDVREHDDVPVTSTGYLFAHPTDDAQEAVVRMVLGDAYAELQQQGIDASLHLSLHTGDDVEEGGTDGDA